MLDNTKYMGHWVWNKTESRRDPRTGRRRRFEKPESEWIVQEYESLRIVPEQLWQTVRKRRQEVRRSWAGPSTRSLRSIAQAREEARSTFQRICCLARWCVACAAQPLPR